MTDGLRRADGRYDGRVGDRLPPPLHTEIKEDQWLGGAVTSQGEIIGHLWPEWGGSAVEVLVLTTLRERSDDSERSEHVN